MPRWERFRGASVPDGLSGSIDEEVARGAGQQVHQVCDCQSDQDEYHRECDQCEQPRRRTTTLLVAGPVKSLIQVVLPLPPRSHVEATKVAPSLRRVRLLTYRARSPTHRA